MATSRVYRQQRRAERTAETRRRITCAVRELLEQGRFHDASVEEIAELARVSRATLYQHFRSRVDLVDAICETFDANPALLELREVVELPDPDAALAKTIALAARFWASEGAVLSQIYGVEAIDPAARDLVARQRADRRGEMERLAHHLHAVRRLPAGTTERTALELLMVLTSYETFRELRLAGLSERQLVKRLQESGRALLLSAVTSAVRAAPE